MASGGTAMASGGAAMACGAAPAFRGTALSSHDPAAFRGPALSSHGPAAFSGDAASASRDAASLPREPAPACERAACSSHAPVGRCSAGIVVTVLLGDGAAHARVGLDVLHAEVVHHAEIATA